MLRPDADKLSPDMKSRPAEGVVAYTAICTLPALPLKLGNGKLVVAQLFVALVARVGCESF
jgi:hypothetical protein